MKKVKYSYQRDEYSCGPTALLNIMRWAGQKITKKYLMKKCGGRKRVSKIGTDVCIFNNLLLDLPGIIVPMIGYKVPLKYLDQHLARGGIVAASYMDDECGHYALIVGRTKKFYLVANALENCAVSRISRKHMRWLLDGENFVLGVHTRSVQWFILKKEK